MVFIGSSSSDCSLLPLSFCFDEIKDLEVKGCSLNNWLTGLEAEGVGGAIGVDLDKKPSMMSLHSPHKAESLSSVDDAQKKIVKNSGTANGQA